jgi:hypothetical protein
MKESLLTTRDKQPAKKPTSDWMRYFPELILGPIGLTIWWFQRQQWLLLATTWAVAAALFLFFKRRSTLRQ